MLSPEVREKVSLSRNKARASGAVFKKASKALPRVLGEWPRSLNTPLALKAPRKTIPFSSAKDRTLCKDLAGLEV